MNSADDKEIRDAIRSIVEACHRKPKDEQARILAQTVSQLRQKALTEAEVLEVEQRVRRILDLPLP
jgi:hypothetical protein